MPSDAPALACSGLRRSFGGTVAVDGVDLTVPTGGLTALLGPSGCGKTTVLRMVAGLLTPDAGTIAIHGRQVSGAGQVVAPEHRGVGMVFQDYALFPHLSVARNVGYGLPRRPRAARRARVAEVAQAHQVEHLGDAGATGGPGPARQPVAHVSRHAEVGEQRVVLEHHPHPAVLGGDEVTAPGDLLAVDGDRALVGGEQARHHAQHGGLAAARGAEQGGEPAGRHREVDAVDGDGPAEGPTESAARQRGRVGRHGVLAVASGR